MLGIALKRIKSIIREASSFGAGAPEAVSCPEEPYQVWHRSLERLSRRSPGSCFVYRGAVPGVAPQPGATFAVIFSAECSDLSSLGL